MANAIDRLIHEFTKLPGVGEKTALRFAFHLLKEEPKRAHDLAQAVIDLKERMRLCSECFGLAEHETCAICKDARRDPTTICVVEDPSDLMAVEKTHVFRGLYHVLHGAISPLDGIGPDELRIKELLQRLSLRQVSEVVLATNVNIEGEATSLYLTRLIKPLDIKLTRLASGLPVGGDLEYIDATTLTRAFEDRHIL
ncbi:MAG: recombination protein RecR [Deltaproteobacteria bacterium]|nr:recombination protein RecR [Deltaproteobacteria bacterium]